MRLYLLKILLLITIVLSPQLFAKPRENWFNVEVIVFEHPKAQIFKETWELDPGLPDFSESISLIADETSHYLPEHYYNLKTDQYTLNDAKERVQARGNRIILHHGWRQTLDPQSTGKPVRLNGGKRYEPQDTRVGNYQGGAWQSEGYSGAASMSGYQYELDGFVRVSRGRYIHVNTDFLFYKPMRILTASTGIGGGLSAGDDNIRVHVANVNNVNAWQQEAHARLQPFRLNQTRRMRSTEVHYFDHPLYGILVSVVPVES